MSSLPFEVSLVELIDTAAACELLGSLHLIVKITDFTDFHPILRVFQQYNLRKLGHYFTPNHPQEQPQH